LITDESKKRVIGVRYTKKGNSAAESTSELLHARSVILATGGFAADRSDLLK
jgi:aspartate oxidase